MITPRGAFERWLQDRLPATDSWTLDQRNIYILPTKAGVAFAFTLLLMLVASINYQLSLGYVLTFLLAGAGAVSMHLTHGTLRALTLHLRPVQPVFAGDVAALDIVVTNPGRARHAIAFHFRDRERAGRSWASCDVPAQGQEPVRLSIVPPRRGWNEVPPLVAETGFPFGLFHAWTVWRPAARVLAWPRPEPQAPALPASRALGGEQPAPRRAGGDEFDGVRAWRRGDRLRQVVWKKVARSGQLVSRETSAAGAREVWLDWDQALAPDPERRLARLAAWVLAADGAGVAWGLRLPGRELPPAQGDAHRRGALDLLAQF